MSSRTHAINHSGKSKYLLECCVDSVESALEAAAGGADRLELCSGLVIGGITPSPALLSQIKDQLSIPVYPLIRPRFGDFLYTKQEIRLMCRDIRILKEYGADGFVIGALRADGSLDSSALSVLSDACEGLPLTLHRAFDVCSDAFQALEDAVALGFSTILTSGQKNTCAEGIPLLKELCRSDKPIRIMAGAGVNATVIQLLLQETELTAFHMSGKKVISSGMQYRNKNVSMGAANLDEYAIWQTDRTEIQKAKELLKLPRC